MPPIAVGMVLAGRRHPLTETLMNVTLIGTGNMGSALAKQISTAGHTLVDCNS
jgi:hypothetical protein